MNPTDPTPEKEWPERFLAGLEASGNVSAAARAAGIHRCTAYERRQSDQAFAAAWVQALEAATDALEEEARRRATTGQSDVLLIFLLKAHRPSKFRDNVKHEHEHGGEIVFRLEYADDFIAPSAPEPAGDPPSGPAV